MLIDGVDFVLDLTDDHGAKVLCAGCRQLVYADWQLFWNYCAERREDGRWQWTKKDTGRLVHVCETVENEPVLAGVTEESTETD